MISFVKGRVDGIDVLLIHALGGEAETFTKGYNTVIVRPNARFSIQC